MPFISVAKWPPPARETVLTKSGASLIFAARMRDGSWLMVPSEHSMGAPDSWLCKAALKSMIDEPKPVAKGQFLLGLDASGTLARRAG